MRSDWYQEQTCELIIEGINSVSSFLNNVNKETYLLDSDNINSFSEKEREIANKIFDVLKWSQLDRNSTFNLVSKNIDEIDVVNSNIIESLSDIGKWYESEKSDIFKPQRILQFSGKEYFFDKFAGKYFYWQKYRWIDKSRWKGTVKVWTVNPTQRIELIKEHSEDWRSWSNSLLAKDEYKSYEAQEKYNFIVEYEIANAAHTCESSNSILKRLEIRAKDMATEEGTHIFPPDRVTFNKILRRERKLSNPRPNIDKILYSPEFSLTLSKQRFLRFCTSIVDNNGLMQQCILWASQAQIDFIKSSPQVFISFWYQGIPSSFHILLVILAYSPTLQKIIPWWFVLLTTDSCLELFIQIFQYMKDEFGFDPNIINIPLQEQLFDWLRQVYPETILLGWYRDLIKKLYNYSKSSSDLSKIDLKELNSNFFQNIKKSFFRFSNLQKTFSSIVKKTKFKEDDVKYQELFAELQSLCYTFSDLLDYTIIKRVSVRPVEQFFEDYIANDLGKLKHVSLTVFISKLIEIENKCIDQTSEFKTINKIQIEADENEDTIDILQIYDKWDKEFDANIKATQERVDWILIESDVEIDPPLKYNRKYRSESSGGTLVKDDYFDWTGYTSNDINREKSLLKLAAEQFDIEQTPLQYPTGNNIKIFNITKVKTRNYS